MKNGWPLKLQLVNPECLTKEKGLDDYQRLVRDVVKPQVRIRLYERVRRGVYGLVYERFYRFLRGTQESLECE